MKATADSEHQHLDTGPSPDSTSSGALQGDSCASSVSSDVEATPATSRSYLDLSQVEGLELAAGRRLMEEDFPSTECVVNGSGGTLSDVSPTKMRLIPDCFGSTEAVINSVEPSVKHGQLSEVVAGLWHDALSSKCQQEHNRGKERSREPKPCFPLPASQRLSHGDTKHLQFVRHRSAHPKVKGIVVFLPGVNGGVGPCRRPGNLSDDTALFPTLAQEISQNHPLECYQVSWSERQPDMSEAVHAVCRVVLYALTIAPVSIGVGSEKMQVFFVGHSFGGGVAFQASRILASLGPTLQAEVAGVVALAPQWDGVAESIADTEVPKLLVHGLNDEELTCGISLVLHNMAALPRELRILKGCNHNFTGHKSELQRVVMKFLLSHCRDLDQSRRGRSD